MKDYITLPENPVYLITAIFVAGVISIYLIYRDYKGNF